MRSLEHFFYGEFIVILGITGLYFNNSFAFPTHSPEPETALYEDSAFPAGALQTLHEDCLESFAAPAQFETVLSDLSGTIERRFDSTILNGIYFVEQKHLKAAGATPIDPYTDPIFNVGKDGEPSLNPLYYTNLMELLAPVFQFHITGVLVVESFTQGHKLIKVLRDHFPEVECEIYNKRFFTNERKKTVLGKLKGTAPYYIISLKEHLEELDLSTVSAYISLDMRGGAEKRIQELYEFFGVYTGLQVSDMVFLDHYGIEDSEELKNWWQFKEAIRTTSVNTEIRHNGIRESSELKMNIEKAMAYIQTWGFTNKRRFERWVKSILRPKSFPSDPYGYYKQLGVWPAGGLPEFLGYEPKQRLTRNVEKMSVEKGYGVHSVLWFSNTRGIF